MLQSIILVCLKKCHSCLINTIFRTQSQGGCDILHPQHKCYTNLTNYALSCTILTQLSRKGSHKPRKNSSIFFNVYLSLYGIQDGFVSSFRKKKKSILYFHLKNILRLFEVMKMTFLIYMF